MCRVTGLLSVQLILAVVNSHHRTWLVSLLAVVLGWFVITAVVLMIRPDLRGGPPPPPKESDRERLGKTAVGLAVIAVVLVVVGAVWHLSGLGFVALVLFAVAAANLIGSLQVDRRAQADADTDADTDADPDSGAREPRSSGGRSDASWW